MKTKLKQAKDPSKTVHRGEPQYPWKISCSSKNRNELYIDAHGIVLPCCWLATTVRKIYPDFFINGGLSPIVDHGLKGKLYDFYDDFVHMIEDEGGIAMFSLQYNTIEDITSNDFYSHRLEELWEKKDCKFCSRYCATNRVKNGYAGNELGRFKEIDVHQSE